VNLLQRGQQGIAFGYITASVVCGLLAAWLGLTLVGMVKAG
jgi:fluoride ion exporter CrcB/FEX